MRRGGPAVSGLLLASQQQQAVSEQQKAEARAQRAKEEVQRDWKAMQDRDRERKITFNEEEMALQVRPPLFLFMASVY